MKSAQLDSTRERMAELEQSLTKRDETITYQKRMLKTVKEEHKEQFNVSCSSPRSLYHTRPKISS